MFSINDEFASKIKKLRAERLRIPLHSSKLEPFRVFCYFFFGIVSATIRHGRRIEQRNSPNQPSRTINNFPLKIAPQPYANYKPPETQASFNSLFETRPNELKSIARFNLTDESFTSDSIFNDPEAGFARKRVQTLKSPERLHRRVTSP